MSSFIIKLSKTGKMPCQSFSLPAQACKTGGKLAQVKGSVCSGCYALKGNYRFPNVKQPRQDNLDSLPSTTEGWMDWVNTLSSQIKGQYFRWHDSGDIQSLAHLRAIVLIAQIKPDVNFWLPTKERGIVASYLKKDSFPDNLVVRVSSAMVDQKPMPVHGSLTSTVHTDAMDGHSIEDARTWLCTSYTCPAYKQEGKCNDCRSCWDSSIKNVSYPKH